MLKLNYFQSCATLFTVSFLLTFACSGQPQVTASVRSNSVLIHIQGEFRIITANGLPNHSTGNFPNPGNPNYIAAQQYNFRIPLHPVPAEKPTSFKLGLFGIATNGVVFDPGAAEWWGNDPSSGWQYEPISGPRHLGVDSNNAHVQPNGAYHYHGVPTGMIAATPGATQRMFLLGWAADGFPIYAPWAYFNPTNPTSPVKPVKSSFQFKKGTRPTGPGGTYDGTFVADFEYVAGSGDLDECNGRFGITPEFPKGTYHYFVTREFPFIPRQFRGTPDPSFLRRGGPPRGRGFGGPGGPGGPPTGGGGPPPGFRGGPPF